MTSNPFVVTERAQRPARMDGCCFYCHQPIGALHGAECVLVVKKVPVRLIIEYDIEVPAHWTANDIEIARNLGSWCSNNLISELEELKEEHTCLCGVTEYEVLDADTSPYLSER